MEELLSLLRFSAHYSQTLYRCNNARSWNAHEDWTIGWSAKGPYSQPLAM